MAPTLGPAKNAGQIHGVPIKKVAPSNTQVLKYNSTTGQWEPAADTSGIGGSTGSTDNAILQANGTGGSTLESSDKTFETTLTDDDTKVPTSGAVIDALTGKVDKSTYDANTVLKADSDNTPIALTVGEDTVVGRLAGGSIAALTVAQMKTLLSITDSMRYKGVISCSGNPNYPAAIVGDTYKVSTAGKIGGASGKAVEIGDAVLCCVAGAEGDEAAVGANWDVLQVNVDGAVTGPASAVDGDIVLFNSTTGKVIKSSTKAFETAITDSDTKVPTSGAVVDYAFSKASDVDLADGKSVKVVKALGTDHTASGTTVTLTAHESVVFGDVCFINASGEAAKADADAAATMPVVAMAIASINADAAGLFLLVGIARDDSWNWTPGAALYADTTTAGGLTATAPTGSTDCVQIVGRALTADIILFKPDNTWLELT